MNLDVMATSVRSVSEGSYQLPTFLPHPHIPYPLHGAPAAFEGFVGLKYQKYRITIHVVHFDKSSGLRAPVQEFPRNYKSAAASVQISAVSPFTGDTLQQL